MSMELFEQGPGVYLPVLFLSILITAFSYSVFPLLIAGFRKKEITAKKYRIFCYLYNFLVMLLFVLLNSRSSGVPYFIWTSLFCALGLKILERKNLVPDSDSRETISESATESSPEVPGKRTEPSAKIRFCKYCGSPIDPVTKKCTGCEKQYFKIPRVERSVLGKVCVILLCAVLLGFMIWCGHLSSVNSRLSEQLTEQAGEIQDLDEKLRDKSSVIQELQRKVVDYKKDIAALNQTCDQLKETLADLEKQIRFYDSYVVFVMEEKPGIYHKYGCLYLKYLSSSIYACDIDVAKELGYTQCTMCD